MACSQVAQGGTCIPGAVVQISIRRPDARSCKLAANLGLQRDTCKVSLPVSRTDLHLSDPRLSYWDLSLVQLHATLCCVSGGIEAAHVMDTAPAITAPFAPGPRLNKTKLWSYPPANATDHTLAML